MSSGGVSKCMHLHGLHSDFESRHGFTILGNLRQIEASQGQSGILFGTPGDPYQPNPANPAQNPAQIPAKSSEKPKTTLVTSRAAHTTWAGVGGTTWVISRAAHTTLAGTPPGQGGGDDFGNFEGGTHHLGRREKTTGQGRRRLW